MRATGTNGSRSQAEASTETEKFKTIVIDHSWLSMPYEVVYLKIIVYCQHTKHKNFREYL